MTYLDDTEAGSEFTPCAQIAQLLDEDEFDTKLDGMRAAIYVAIVCLTVAAAIAAVVWPL